MDAVRVLDTLVDHLPMYTWRYRSDPDTVHIGPMAQDVHRLFGIGTPTNLAPVAQIGLMLTGLKALATKHRELEATVHELRSVLAACEKHGHEPGRAGAAG